MPRPRTPTAVIVTNPLPPGRAILNRSVVVTPDQMEKLVGEPPRYDASKPQDQELARWIGWSAKRLMAEQIAEMADRTAAKAESSG